METRQYQTAAEELYRCFTSMRTTTEGILASNSINVWNVYGGLNRAKTAIFDIFSNGLRCSEDVKVAPVKILFDELILKFPCEVFPDVDDDSEVLLFSWIEQHLLDHSLSQCIKDGFIKDGNNSTGKSIAYRYHDYAFLRNSDLLMSFTYCLEALEHNSMNMLSSISPMMVNKTTFLAKIAPWVTEKMMEESKSEAPPINGRPPGFPKVNNLLALPVRIRSSSLDSNLSRCEKCNMEQSSNKLDSEFCQCANYNQETFQVKKRSIKRVSKRPISQDVLIKSALSAVHETREEHDNMWYEEDSSEGLSDGSDAIRSRLARTKEISRSESSLFQESSSMLKTECDRPHAHSDYDDRDSDQSGSSKDRVSLSSNHELLRSSPVTTSAQRGKKGHTRSKSDQIGVPATFEEDTSVSEDAKRMNMSSSLPDERIKTSKDQQNYYYQCEDGTLFPKPYEGQSLLSYLDSRSYDTGAQLDKENAHFSICEALITAIEQMQCKNLDSGNETDDSDEEIMMLKQRLVERRRQVKKEKVKRETAFSDPSDTGKSSSFKTSSTYSSSYGSSFTEGELRHEGLSISASWENVSIASSKTLSPTHETKKEEVSEVDNLEKATPNPDDSSAEAVAKSLLKKFAGQDLPAASDLKWMVSEDQVPQELLPLPNALPVSPDDALLEGSGESYDIATAMRRISVPSLLRGNLEWAPPRPQIIFVPHPFAKRKISLQRQHYRCAGCGLKVTASLSKRFRYCEYLGKYFCTSCHQNKLALIPSKIMSKWDFKKYPVSDFAKELLKKILKDPLFNILDIAPNLYKNVRFLAIARELRLKLHFVKNFLRACRFAENHLQELLNLPLHLIDDPHVYSIDDFVQVKTGHMQSILRSVVSDSIDHVISCPLCQVKGFVCEFCRNGEDVLFPFDLLHVNVCKDCKACYHRTCFVAGKCPKCERLRARHRMISEQLPDLPDS